ILRPTVVTGLLGRSAELEAERLGALGGGSAILVRLIAHFRLGFCVETQGFLLVALPLEQLAFLIRLAGGVRAAEPAVRQRATAEHQRAEHQERGRRNSGVHAGPPGASVRISGRDAARRTARGRASSRRGSAGPS